MSSLPVAFTTPWPGGVHAEKEYARQAEALGAQNSRPMGVEYFLTPEALQVSYELGIKWKAWPDWVTTVFGPPLLKQQFTVFVRGQRDCYPDLAAWNFTFSGLELDASRRWFENRQGQLTWGFVSWTGSVHIASSWMLARGRPGIYANAGYWSVNAVEAGLPTLADVLRNGLPYAPM